MAFKTPDYCSNAGLQYHTILGNWYNMSSYGGKTFLFPPENPRIRRPARSRRRASPRLFPTQKKQDPNECKN
jgi:hypothetical protein